MINGNINEFINNIYYGSELVFKYSNAKYMLQGFKEDGIYNLYLDRLEPPANDYVWVGKGDDKGYPVEGFLNAQIWNGLNFISIEDDVEWLDC